jgi:type I restriction enzyme S subunit
MRVSNVDKHSKDGEEPVRLCNYIDVYKNEYIRPSMDFMRATATKDEIARFRLAPGDVLITKDSEAWNDIGVPALVIESADDTISGYHLALLRPFAECVIGGYLFRALQCTGVAYQFHVGANGVTRYGLSHAAIKSVWLPMPSLAEQAAIVRFLDHACSRIRRYIAAKQKLIKLLEEEKQAIIHRAVTRGLDPDVRLKPSGVPWLGDVPEQWEMRLLGRTLLRIDQGWSPVAAEGDLQADQWAVLTLSSVKKGLFDPTAIKPVPVTANVPNGIEIKDGELLLTRSNTRELVGDVCVTKNVRPRTVMCDLIYQVAPDISIFDSTFLMFQLLSRVGRNQIERDARGSSGTMPKIAQRLIRGWQVLVPPLDEQRSIVAAIGGMTSRIAQAEAWAHREVALLREYRTRLIADVVTGKLDVREAAAKLPDRTPDGEAADETGNLSQDEELAGATELEVEDAA